MQCVQDLDKMVEQAAFQMILVHLKRDSVRALEKVITYEANETELLWQVRDLKVEKITVCIKGLTVLPVKEEEEMVKWKAISTTKIN